MLPRVLFTSLIVLTFMIDATASSLLVDPSGVEGKTYPTIQAAVDAARPGDVVEIRGGVYFEQVNIKQGGEEGRPITVQAAPNELVLINAGRKLAVDLKPAEGLPEVFVAQVENGLISEKIGIWETPSRLRMARVQNPGQTAHRLGAWYHDAEGGKLYLRSSGQAPANELVFWVESADKPAITVSASHVHLRNLQVTLGQHGILVAGKISHVTVEGCRAFCNSWAGIHVTGNDHLILRNETFQNNTYGIQLRNGVNRVHVRENLCYFNGPNNGESTGNSVPTDLGIYSLGDYNLFEGNFAEGIHEDVYRNKTGHGASPSNVLRNNVIKGNQTPGTYGVYDNTLLVSGLGMRHGMYRDGGAPSPMRAWKYVDPDGVQRASNLIHPLVQEKDPHFADPSYRDYRLQADSPYLGSGAFPERGTIFYVDPVKGSDTNSGLSLSEALATPQPALDRLPASATLYLLPGDYTDPLVLKNGGLDSAHPLRIRAFGKSKGVKISGGLRLTGGQFVEIDGVEFASRLDLEKFNGVAVKHSVFSGEAAGITAVSSPGLRVDRCTFVENATALRLTASPHAGVTQSLFVECESVQETDTASSEKGFFDFNAYSRHRSMIQGKRLEEFSAWKSASGQDRHSEISAIRLSPGFVLSTGDRLTMQGADFGHLGARIEDAASQLELTDLRVAGLSPHGVTLLWNSPRKTTFAEITLKSQTGEVIRSWEPSLLLQIMGASFDITKLTAGFFSSQRHAAVSELKPGVAYSATITARDLAGNRSKPFEIAFRTPNAYAEPVTYYVSPKGSDTADGKSSNTPWGSFSHASAQLGPGDELVLLSGTYREILRPRVSGTPERKIKIRSESPQGAVIDMAAGVPVAVEVLNINNVEISGLLIAGGVFPYSQCYLLDHAEGITIRDCEMDYPAVANFENLKLGYSGLVAHRAPGLTVENNLFLCGMVGVAASHSPGSVIRQNTIVGEGNYGVVLVPGDSEESYSIQQNLFYRAVLGYKLSPCIWVFEPMPRLVSDNNLFFIPEKDKGTIGTLPGTERLFPLEAWTAATGLDKSSLQAQPEFVAPEARNFSLKPGSPGKGKAGNGRDIGRVK